jgi:hypothetical protein
MCKHKFTRVNWTYLRTVREKSAGTVIGMPVWANYDYFSELHMCDKCSKAETRKVKYLAKDHQSSVLY